jgi:hypothetical protein
VGLVITSEAADYIAERGSRLYVWQEQIGHAWFVDRVGFHDPNRGLSFSSIPISGVTLLLASDLDPPETLHVGMNRLPRRLRIEWDGKPWGARGTVEGGG